MGGDVRSSARPCADARFEDRNEHGAEGSAIQVTAIVLHWLTNGWLTSLLVESTLCIAPRPTLFPHRQSRSAVIERLESESDDKMIHDTAVRTVENLHPSAEAN